MAIVAKHWQRGDESSDLAHHLAKNVLQLSQLLVLEVRQGAAPAQIQRRLSLITGAMIQLEGLCDGQELERD